MIEVRSAPVGASHGGYDSRVKAAIAAMRRKAQMTQEEFALALSKEIGDGRQIRGHWVSRWESGDYMPKGDVVLAALAVSGAMPSDISVDPRVAAAAIRNADLERQIRKLTADRDGKKGGIRNRLDLDPAEGPLENYLTAAEVVALLKVSRQHLYTFLRTGKLKGYRSGGRTLYLRSEVLTLQVERQNSVG